MSFHVIKPDSTDQSVLNEQVTVFLAGSIDNGKATLWANRVQDALSDIPSLTVFNPRRDEWSPNLKQSKSEPLFRYQVEWEIEKLDNCDIPFFYFEPDSVSPITLQELGFVIGFRRGLIPDHIHAPIVCCPDGFWRKGNVEIMCDLYNIAVHNDLNTAITSLRNQIVIAKETK